MSKASSRPFRLSQGLTADTTGFRAHISVAAAVFIITFAVYLSTLAPDITWAYDSADGAELITAAVTLGVPHPPGYPLYVLIGKLIAHVPLGTVAFRFNLLSAICAAIAAALVALLTAELTGELLAGQTAGQDLNTAPRNAVWAAGLFSGATFAFVPLVWQQAIVAEVYALNLALVAAVLHLSIAARHKRGSGLFTGLFLGLALTTHLTSLFLWPLALLFLGSKRWLSFLSGMLLGLSPFLLLPLWATGDSPVVWGSPVTAQQWWWLVSAKIYHPNLLSLPAEQWPDRLAAWIAAPSLWIAIALSAVTLLRWSQLEARARRTAGVALFSAWLYFVHAFAYDTHDSIVFTLPAFALITIAATMSTPSFARQRLLLPLALVVLNFQHIDLSAHYETRRLAQIPMREAPPGAIVLTSGDQATFTLWYLQYVEGQRQDLVIVDDNLLAFEWYRQRLQHTYPEVAGLAEDNVEKLRMLNWRQRPWCSLRFEVDYRYRLSCMENAS